MAQRPSPLSFIQFGALTAEEWLSFAIKIDRPYNRGSQEVERTPYDLGLGALANGAICPTCGQTNKLCPGHWGCIELEEPCYNPEYIDYVLGIFKCVCIHCCSPLIPENMTGALLSLSRSARFKAYKKRAETIKQCPVCQKPTASFFIDKHNIKMYYEDKKNATPISAREACAILMKVSGETMKLIGFNDGLSQNPVFSSEEVNIQEDKIHVHEVRPEAFIFTVLPVMPTCARPWVIKGSERKDDDITDKYNTILKNNERLRADREAPSGAQPVRGKKKNGKLSEGDRNKTIEDLYANIWSIIDNSKEKSKNSSRKHKGLRERLGQKDGHIQSNVAGKRADYTARTVIVGGGSLIKMGWVGIPYHVAKVLTTPELVLEWNISECTRLLSSGKINTVCRNGYVIDVQEVTGKGTKPFQWKGQSGLQLYDIVHRQLRDGDWGVFNRQPTLRIESMQGVQVKILPGGDDMNIFDQEYAFRLSLGMTRPLNADFDGDECNFHAPQSQGARIENSTISKTAFHMVSAQNNAPIMGCVQNTLVCMYVITETFLTPEGTADGDDLLPNYTFPDGTQGYQTMIDLSDFMDAVAAAEISMERYNDLVKRAAKYYPDHVIEDDDGALRLTDRIPGKIVASIVFPPTFTWSRDTGVNEKLPVVSIKDGIILPSSGPLEKKSIGGASNSAIHPLWKEGPEIASQVVSEFQFMTAVLITRIGFSMGPSDCFPTGEIDVETVRTEALIKCEMILASNKDPADKEREINGVLNDAMGIAPKLAKMGMNKKDRNALVIMKKSGAKGSDTNNGQIAGFVGQQNIDGKRVNPILCDGTKTLPHFFPGDGSPDARGFVRHSYLEGLTFTEVWFHAMGGRRGVVDTAMKTADSGYIQKKIVNAINDFKVQHDGTVRDANGGIVQFAYGSDGFNAKELMPCGSLSFPFFVNPTIIAARMNSEAERLQEDEEVDIGEMRELTKEETNLMVSFIEYTCAGKKTEVSERITFNIKTVLRAIIKGVKIYEYMIPHFCRKIKDEFEEARAKSGYMGGLVAASSIGEPTTQMTLNTFHNAGNSAKDVTLGVPRFNELINATKNPSKPTCTVYLNNEDLSENLKKRGSIMAALKKAEETKKEAVIAKLKEQLAKIEKDALYTVTDLSSPLAYITADYFIKTCTLKYLSVENANPEASPIGLLTYEEYAPEWWVTLSEELGNIPRFKPQAWIILLTLDIEKMYRFGVTVEDIAVKIEENGFGTRGYTMACVPSPNVIGQIEVYLNFSEISEYVRSEIELPRGETVTRHLITPENMEYFVARDVAVDLIKKTEIQGIRGIQKTYVRQEFKTGEWLIDTQGTNLMKLLGLPGIDATRTMSDDMWEIYKVLGVEATRKFLFREKNKILSFDGAYINPRHIYLLVDAMTRSGSITSVNRDGIPRDVGPIAKGLFEKAVDNFHEASAFAEHDKMKGVAAAVMFGTLPEVGSGTVEIKDSEKLPAKRKPLVVPTKPGIKK